MISRRSNIEKWAEAMRQRQKRIRDRERLEHNRRLVRNRKQHGRGPNWKVVP